MFSLESSPLGCNQTASISMQTHRKALYNHQRRGEWGIGWLIVRVRESTNLEKNRQGLSRLRFVSVESFQPTARQTNVPVRQVVHERHETTDDGVETISDAQLLSDKRDETLERGHDPKIQHVRCAHGILERRLKSTPRGNLKTCRALLKEFHCVEPAAGERAV